MLSLADERQALEDLLHRSKRRRTTADLPASSRTLQSARPSKRSESPVEINEQLSLRERKQLAYGSAYKPEEESLRQDYGLEHIHTGRQPANFILGAALDKRFDEYPKLERLVHLHSGLVDSLAIPPTYLQTPSYDALDLNSLLPTRFDCILIDPPSDLDWDRLAAMPIPAIAAQPSFIWIWCGSGNTDGLERGRELLAKWGYRRCEDITWVKTNKRRGRSHGTSSAFLQSKEHCLMGIRGTVKRSTDAHFVHCNVDTDVIVWEPDEKDPSAKPPELYNIIENFCLGTRRLQLFYPPHKARRGWLTVGLDGLAQESEAQQYRKEVFDAGFDPAQGGMLTVPNTPEIDALRPRSPPPREGRSNQSGGGIGRGRGHAVPPRPQMFQPQPQPMMMPPQYQQMPNPGMAMMGMPPFNPMAAMMPFNPMNPMMMMGGGMPQAMDWTAFFKNQQSHNR